MKRCSFEELYKTGRYLELNPTVHEEDATWKFDKIKPFLDRYCNINEKRELKLLDIGGGTGSVSLYCQNYMYKKYGKKIIKIAIDLSLEMLKLQKQKKSEKDSFINANAKNLPIKNKSIDLTFLIDVLEHLNPRDLDFILSRLAHYLKINGKLIIVVPSINIPLDRKHYQHFSRKTLEKLLKKYFKTINILGHQRISKIHNFFFSVLNFVSLLFYADTFRYKYPKFIHKFCNFKKHYWIKNLHICDPEIARRLLAVCVKE